MTILKRFLLALLLPLCLAACAPADDESKPRKMPNTTGTEKPRKMPARSAFSLFSAKKGQVRHSVAVSDIRRGIRRQDPRDVIPPIYKPKFVAADRAGHLKDSDRVIGLRIGAEARAYPMGVLDRHEIVIDTVGGIPVAITYCPLCGTAIAFDRRVKGRVLTFGVSGYLYQSDLLMWDHETESFWSQIRGNAVAGPMTDTVLARVPVRVTKWKAWRTEFPETKALVGPYGAKSYAVYPYGTYRTNRKIIFPVKKTNPKFHPKTLVTGIKVAGAARAYPHELLKKAGATIVDTVGGEKLEIRYDAANDSCRIFDAQGTELPSLTAFWFAWYTFHPETTVFEPETSSGS